MMTSARDSNRTRNENNIEIERKLFQRIHALMLLKFVIKAKKEKDLSTLARLQNLLLVNELLRGGYAVGYKSGFSLLLKCCDNIKLIENYEKTSQSIIFKAALQPWRIPEKKWITKEMGTFFGRAKLFQMYEDQGIPVFVKLTRAYDNEDSFREIEGKIGIHIINKMVRDRTTPHMMIMLAVEHSNNVPGDVDQLIRTEQTHTNIGVLKAPVKHLFTPESYSNYDINLTDSARMRHLEKLAKRGTLLMAECGNGTEFRYWVKKHGLNNTLLFPIIFQILYNLYVMDTVQLTHYDLHVGNIWIQKTDSVTEFKSKKILSHKNPTQIYFIDEEEYVVLKFGPNSGFVRFFDWDFGYEKSLITEKQKESRKKICTNYGICNTHKSAADIFRIFYNLRLYAKQQIISKDLLVFMIKMFGYEDDPDPNKNVLKNGLPDRYENPYYPFLCNYERKQFKRKENKLVMWKCNGEWQGDEKSIPSAQRFVQSFCSFGKYLNVLKTNKLPEWDINFLPGTLNWNSYVYIPTVEMRKIITAKIEKMSAEKNQIKVVHFE